ncbi:MAG: phosphate ABC transporter substrate-binding protein PstS [Acidobacteriaceae bacterium]|nr:phosphate ABC transporter substrate-binding protein PstS [Acidobacteriaceae bacterium]MBV9764197.1 phosphate ABC transporter substrate-binding protein PstS [Acidobacteriaceae bacterium]
MRSHTGQFSKVAFLWAAAATLPLGAQTQVTGAGATFPAPIYQKWFNDYQSVGKVQINYQPNGSGGGIKSVTEGTADFGASDMPMTDAQLQTFKSAHGYNVLLFPTVLGADVPTYNVPGITQELNFTPEALAGIFLGKIKTWNDPAIAKPNPGVKLPGDNIVVVHRSDGSGTTFCWTDYLSKVSSEWASKVGKNTSVDWPTGLGAKGNDGVAGMIKQQKGSFGYVELIYAVRNHLPYGKVRNKSGEFVKADLQSVSAAAAALKEMPADFRVSITDESGKGVYPISTFTWLLIPEKIPDAAKRNALIGFLKWAITTGQNSVESLDYAKLPQQVVAKEESAIAQIK